jgi:hypothetical protein
MSSISATIAGSAHLAPAGTDEEKFYIDKHLENNTFDDGAPQQTDSTEDGRLKRFVAGEEVRVIVVDIKEVRISDYKGTVRDWALLPQEQMVNGHS